MKTNLLLLILAFIGFLSCHPKNRSEEIATYAYSSEIELSKKLQDKVGSWIEEGLDCYGILVMYDDDGGIVAAKAIKAKALVITSKAIKMKALETVTLAPKIGCTKLGLETGDTWWENDGDLFQTKKEAEAFLIQIQSDKNPKRDGQFAIK